MKGRALQNRTEQNMAGTEFLSTNTVIKVRVILDMGYILYFARCIYS